MLPILNLAQTGSLLAASSDGGSRQCSASGDVGTQLDSSSAVDLELHHHFLQPQELLDLQQRASAVPEADWLPCSCRAEAATAVLAKECAHVDVGQDPVAAGVLGRLAMLTGSSTSLETLPLVRYRPGATATPLHVDHLPDGARVDE
ncbi:hypothetical protein EMIHUDRAFT_250969 [Emiliania huxleyi CCMP1516]|nr:hypothetical protein EMIHUDRAFT_250969 [Emiliania huxleyi CCMP1516]EOD40946.1 hypothetical protein EMIHUDRAFT_250969 [Emiliania huxleyi CCMP1516]|eukprot:XP_005793375.1 hypothetical protein EMIHUDRAFT_250969 [Emiliania huxleyi CCMP1516]